MRFVSSRYYQPQRVRALAESMGVDEADYGAFREAVKSLSKSGRVVFGGSNTVMLPEMTGRIQGIYRANQRGFGFVVPTSPSHSDLYIPKGHELDAITGDTVIAKVVRKGHRAGKMIYEGQIVEVVERGRSQFVGKLHREASQWFVVPDGKVLHVPILVEDVGAKRAKAGDQVVVELLKYPSPRQPARGVIIERLGRAGTPKVDLLSVIRQFRLPQEFDKPLLKAAGRAARALDDEGELARREDLRDRVTVTIDPDTAKDFDDAITLEKVRDGWELGVHIADVSHFVRPGEPLDVEARRRGNSVYFPGYVIPMLPEVLSNGVCSLQEGVDRLTKGVFIRYDRAGRPRSSRLTAGVIRSDKRLTYEQATAILEGRTKGFARKIVNLVREMERLARVIRKRRLEDGMLVLDLPEVELVLDDDGRPVSAQPADTSFSHTIIEMFMVEGNEAVARTLNGAGVPFLRRVHPDPDLMTRNELNEFVRVVGHKLPKRMGRKDVQRLLDAVRGKPASFAVNLAVLRSMMPAEYSPKTQGHYALASKHYAHFTSPIRRYPDLTVHRLVAAFLKHGFKTAADKSAVPSAEELTELGDHCSFTERQAEHAERDFKTLKLLQLLETRIGEQFPGVVTGVTNSGIFVQISEYMIDGLIRFDDLPDDWWGVNRKTGSVVGERTGMRITIGDLVDVVVVAVNIPARELDLAIVNFASSKPGKKTKRGYTGAKSVTRKKTVRKVKSRPKKKRKR